MKMRITTLCYIENGGRTLMLYRNKKKNDINAGKWVGVGGALEAGESPEDCLVREVWEETGIRLEPSDFDFRGIVTFSSDLCETEYMCLYSARTCVTSVTDCNEGELAWIDNSRLDALPMWEGDRIFFDLMRRGEKFFSLKLCYEGDSLRRAYLNGRSIDCSRGTAPDPA